MQNKSQNKRGRVGIVLVLLAVFFGVGMTLARNGIPNNHETWTVLASSGQVEFRGAENAESSTGWNAVRRGELVPDYSIVRTGKRGRATLARNDSLIVVAPRSEIELPPAGNGAVQSSVIQNQGSVLYKIDGKKNPHFEVVTPYLVAGVKGTEFMVSVKGEYASITVDEGEVRVTDPTSGDELDVRGGEFAMRDRARPELEFRRDNDNDDSQERRRESRMMARLENDLRKGRSGDRDDQSSDGRSGDKGEPGRDFTVARADGVSDDVSKDDLSDDLSDDFSFDDDRSDDESDDSIAAVDDDLIDDRGKRNHGDASNREDDQ